MKLIFYTAIDDRPSPPPPGPHAHTQIMYQCMTVCYTITPIMNVNLPYTHINRTIQMYQYISKLSTQYVFKIEIYRVTKD